MRVVWFKGRISWGFAPVEKFPAASSSESSQRGGLGAYFAWLPVVAVAYFLLAKLGLQLASIHPSASPIWAPTGLALATVILGGVRFFPAILIGAFAAKVAGA